MEKNREVYNRSSSFNCYKVSCKEPVIRHGRSGVGRGDSSAGGFSWPPIRSYSCSFCKREFRSAQALGGHMNVHRRDRARLRHYSPPWNLSPSNPNPNLISSNRVPNLNMPPPSNPTCPGFISPAATVSCSSSSVSLAEAVGLRGWRNFMEEGGRKDGIPSRHEAADLVHLDLDMGMPFGDFDDSLDLELRLGCT